MNDLAKNLLTWAIIAIVLVSIFNHFTAVNAVPDQIAYSQFLADVRSGQVSEVKIEASQSGNRITGRLADGSDFESFGPPDNKLIDDLVDNDVRITAEPPAGRLRRCWKI